jgi:hypothetical protein
MKWKKRQAEIARLRRRHPVLRVNDLPNLREQQSEYSAPSLTSTGVSTICSRTRTAASAKLSGEFFVGALHKSSMQVLFKSELPWGGGKKP